MRAEVVKVSCYMHKFSLQKLACSFYILIPMLISSCGKTEDTSGTDSQQIETGESGTTGVKAYNVLLILTDTFRADHMGTYGYSRDTTPWFDTFAQGAVLFESATSQNAWTPASVSSLFTGLKTF